MPFTELSLFLPSRLLVFVLVLTRVSGLVMTAPVLASRNAPLQVRALLAVGVALMVTPTLAASQIGDPGTLVNLAVLLVGEAIIGLTLGMGVMILFSGIQLAGHVMGQMSGAQIADVFDPSFDQSVPIYAQLMDLVTLSVFVMIGGHRLLMDALLSTFQALPLGGGGYHSSMTEAMTSVLTQSFHLGIRAAAPAMIALLLSLLILGLISRTLPQLNILAVGFSLNAIVMLAALALSLGGIAWIFQEEVGPTVEMMRSVIVDDK